MLYLVVDQFPLASDRPDMTGAIRIDSWSVDRSKQPIRLNFESRNWAAFTVIAQAVMGVTHFPRARIYDDNKLLFDLGAAIFTGCQVKGGESFSGWLEPDPGKTVPSV